MPDTSGSGVACHTHQAQCAVYAGMRSLRRTPTNVRSADESGIRYSVFGIRGVDEVFGVRGVDEVFGICPRGTD